MKKILLLTLCLLPFLPTASFAQNHAQTSDQCDADATAWTSDAKEQLVSELKLRMQEMLSCGEAYPQGRLTYSLALITSLGVIQNREQKFIERHGMKATFEDEDRLGMR